MIRSGYVTNYVRPKITVKFHDKRLRHAVNLRLPVIMTSLSGGGTANDTLVLFHRFEPGRVAREPAVIAVFSRSSADEIAGCVSPF